MSSNSAISEIRFINSKTVLETIHVLVTQSFREERSRIEPEECQRLCTIEKILCVSGRNLVSKVLESP